MKEYGYRFGHELLLAVSKSATHFRGPAGARRSTGSVGASVVGAPVASDWPQNDEARERLSPDSRASSIGCAGRI